MFSEKKRLKLDPKSKESLTSLLSKIQEKRENCAESVLDYKINKSRVKVLSFAKLVQEHAKGIVYWMSRDQRVQDNWALLFAQKLAIRNKIPLFVCFCLVSKCLNTTIRHYDFMLKGLEEVESECNKLNIGFQLLLGKAEDVLINFVDENKIGAVVTDFSPLRSSAASVEEVKNKLHNDIPFIQDCKEISDVTPLIDYLHMSASFPLKSLENFKDHSEQDKILSRCIFTKGTIDAHNIVPCWEASPKLEYGARTIRSKINSKLPDFLTEFPPVIIHPHDCQKVYKKTDWIRIRKTLEVDESIHPVDWAKPGYTGGIEALKHFLSQTLKNYHKNRNDPTANCLSNLSPWFHFGQISVQRAILCVQEYKSKYSESVNVFCEEAIVRRELADNFCFYNTNYDSLEGTNEWARKTLNDHRKDKRSYIYSLDELEKSKTHDDLWNAAQKQLVKIGKMHGFLRMYWAKKILEWTNSPEEALKFAIYLNDKYSLDGQDPNGYVGCMWSICGVHDQGWAERPIFGKIRYMNYEGCKRKFDVAAFVSKWK